MKDSFAFASGAVRALENGLLNRSFFNTLSQAEPGEMRKMLIDRGFTGFEKTADPDEALRDRMETVYAELLPYLADESVLDAGLLPHDFHNLKVALKGLIRGGKRQDLFLLPAKCDPDEMWEAVSGKAWDDLPPFLREAAREGYEILTQTGSGQMLDLELDRRCLTAVLEAAGRVGGLARRWAERFVIYADLKTALRLSRQDPGEALIRCALAPVPGLDTAALAEAIPAGEGATCALIREKFDELPDPESASAAALEKAMEDRLTELLTEARSVPCGPEVPLAYYLARETERKNVCILVSAALAGRRGTSMTERLREPYA